MIDDHGEAVVSDLSEYHRIDLVAAIRDHTHSPRMLLVRLLELPDTSALAASIRGEPRGWGTDRHLFATLVDAIQANTWVLTAANSKKKPRRPKPVPRPGRSKRRVIRVKELKGR